MRARSRCESLIGHTTGTTPAFSRRRRTRRWRPPRRRGFSLGGCVEAAPSFEAWMSSRTPTAQGYPFRQEREQPARAEAKPSTSTSDAGLTRTPPPPASACGTAPAAGAGPLEVRSTYHLGVSRGLLGRAAGGPSARSGSAPALRGGHGELVVLSLAASRWRTMKKVTMSASRPRPT